MTLILQIILLTDQFRRKSTTGNIVTRPWYQLVNHLDKMREMTEDKMQPKVIIRVAVGSKKPFSAGPQHTQDHTEALKLMLTDIDVISLNEPEDVFPAFEKAYNRTDGKSTLVIEYSEYYGTK